MKKESAMQRADLFVEQAQQFSSSSRRIHEKLDKTNEWHGKQNAVIHDFIC